MHCKLLQCDVKAASVAFDDHSVVLWLAEHNCTSMSGAITYAKRLDPKVTQIYTIAGFEPDTLYRLDAGKWTAYDPVHVVKGAVH